MAKEEEDQGFRVTDKRLFDEQGILREESADAGRNEAQAGRPRDAADEPVRRGEAPPGTGARIDFPSYILSYYTQSLVLLGEVPNPYSNKKEEDLEAARHTVDILGMLKEKTKGNLAPEEEQLLESVLYEVRMKYMAKINKIKLP
jgi:hypothetical protein